MGIRDSALLALGYHHSAEIRFGYGGALVSLPVKLKDVVDALEEAGDQFSHYLDKRTGEIFMFTSDDWRAAESDDLISEYPDWQKGQILKAREILGSDDFVRLPGEFDIHEYNIMEQFCLSYPNDRVGEELLRAIKGKGAFGRFKGTIHLRGIEKAWYAFLRQELEAVAIEWLEQEEIPYTRDDELDSQSELPM